MRSISSTFSLLKKKIVKDVARNKTSKKYYMNKKRNLEKLCSERNVLSESLLEEKKGLENEDRHA